MNLVLDVQCFKSENNKFIVKELAAFDGERISHVVFKPPYPFDMLSADLKKQAQWLTNNYHCIEWWKGSTPGHYFSKIIADITSSAERIYVKGCEKVVYLQEYIATPIIQFDEKPTLLKSTPKCFYHSHDYCMCALSNVFYLYENFIMH